MNKYMKLGDDAQGKDAPASTDVVVPTSSETGGHVK